MILDQLLLFDTAVAITATADSTNVLDFLNARDMGIGAANGGTPKLMVQVMSALLAAGAATLNVQCQLSTDNVTYTVAAESGVIGKALLTAGRYVLAIDFPRPQPGQALPRYCKLTYVVATGPFTGGTITAAVVLSRDDLVSYPPGFTVAN